MVFTGGPELRAEVYSTALPSYARIPRIKGARVKLHQQWIEIRNGWMDEISRRDYRLCSPLIQQRLLPPSVIPL